MKKSIGDFEIFLREKHLSDNSVKAYVKAVTMFENMYLEWTVPNLNAYKDYLIANHKPQTVNLRVLAINKYLAFTGRRKLQLKPVKLQGKCFSDNVISQVDYSRIKNGLLAENDKQWFFMVWTMGATGARVSELLQIRIEDIVNGHKDLVSKGGKSRRLYFPLALRNEIIRWGTEEGRLSGYLFINNKGCQITTRGFSIHLKKIAERYGIDKSVVYPHSFRHMFAKNFIEKYADISMLADLLGHENVKTTQIYLRRSSREQSMIVDNIVSW